MEQRTVACPTCRRKHQVTYTSGGTYYGVECKNPSCADFGKTFTQVYIDATKPYSTYMQ